MYFVLNSLLDGDDDYYDNPEDYINDAVRIHEHRMDHWIEKPMTPMYPDFTIICFDAEGVDVVTSEYGFAWYRTSDLISTESGRHGQDWLPRLKARRFLVDEYNDHERS